MKHETRLKHLIAIKDVIRSKGKNDLERAENLGLSTVQYRVLMDTINGRINGNNMMLAWQLHKEGMIVSEIAEYMHAPESSVRAWIGT